jgi:hypothetical protein
VKHYHSFYYHIEISTLCHDCTQELPMPPYFAVPPISRFFRPDFFHPKIREIGG